MRVRPGLFFRLALFPLGMAACSRTDASFNRPPGAAAEATSDRQVNALSAIVQKPHVAVCQNGVHCFARVRTNADGTIAQTSADGGAASIQGLGPADLASAYGYDVSQAPGATIAIIDAFGYPNAESDLAAYRAQFGLPVCSTDGGCLRVVNQQGQASPLPPPSTAADDWSVEIALDLDMASAGCPNCKLLLIEANDDTSDGLFVAQQTAVALGASVISNSWGGPEQAGTDMSQLEAIFNHPGVATFVSSGDMGFNDDGAGPQYPATSAYVTAVGGTSLVKTPGTPRGWTEGVWGPFTPYTGAGGSGCSLNIAKPAWQTNSVCPFRAASDVAAVGDPNTGVAVYNNGPSAQGWIVVGGTSAASPLVAAIYALTGHGVEGPSFAYANPQAFYDVTAGNNAVSGETCGTILCAAGPGWDGPTGFGTPNGAALAAVGPTPQDGGVDGGPGPDGGGWNPDAGWVSDAGSSDGGSAADGGNAACGPSTCAGCCDVNGVCQGGTDNLECGAGGQLCAVCLMGQVCQAGACVGPADAGVACGPINCAGCCDGNGTCQAGASDQSCGAQGASCAACAAGDTCNGTGQCVGSGGSCAHPLCSTGDALNASCDSCATQICTADDYCCATAWDEICVGEVASVCGQSCGGGACSHPVCATGNPLVSSCSRCATDVCNGDAYCCTTRWDAQCVSEVSFLCGTGC